MYAKHLALAATAAVLLIPAPAAWAGQGADGTRTGDGGSASVSNSSQTQASTANAKGSNGNSSGSSVPDPCYYTATTDIEVEALNQQYGKAPGSGTWIWQECPADQKSGQMDSYNPIFIPNGTAGPQVIVDPRVLADQAKADLHLPAPEVNFNPTPEQLVNLATWLWVSPSSWTADPVTRSQGTVSVTVSGTPQRVVWNMGDGKKTCDYAGTPYDWTRPNATTRCSYTYRHSSAGQHPSGGPADAYPVTATVEWAVSYSYSIGGAPGGSRSLGTVSRTSAPSFVRVAEDQAINDG